MDNKAKIVLYAMVKNEQEVLERMFESCLPLISGAFFLDTGSTDNTINIIEDLKLKNPKLNISYEKTEFENFVDTRNFGFSYVNSIFKDFDYILTMDADEFWIGDTSEVLKFINENIGASAFDSKIKESGGTMYNRTRFIHIDDDNNKWRFAGPGAHEYITNKINSLIQLPIPKIHSDYGVFHDHPTNKNYEKKFELESRLLMEYVDSHNQNDGDYARALYYLGNTFNDWGKNTESIIYYTKYINLIEEFKMSGRWYFVDEFYDSLLKIAKILTNIGKFKNALDYYNKAIEVCPSTRREAYFNKANLLQENKDFFVKSYYEYEEIDNITIDLIYKIHNVKMDAESILLWFNTEFVWNYFYTWATLYLSNFGDTYYELINSLMKDWESGYYLTDKIDKKSLNTINNLHNLSWISKEFLLKSVTEKTQTIDRYFDKIYVLNLDYRKDRWKDMEFRLEYSDIHNYERFDAYNGTLLEPLANNTNRLLRSGSYLACTLSHLEMIARAKRNNYNKILILEDDIKIHKNANLKFSKLINEADLHHPNWDIIYFGHICFDENENIFLPKNDRNLFNTHQEKISAYGLFGYAISERMYSIILNRFQKLDIELDLFLTSEIQNNLDYNCLVAFPQIFAHTETYSDNVRDVAKNSDAWLNAEFSTPKDYIF